MDPNGKAVATTGGTGGGQHHHEIPRIAYVYSVPLIHRIGDELTEPDVLDTVQELQSLRKTLQEAGRKLLFRAEVATVRNFRFLVTLGCRMLHYTGHGNPTYLIFENGQGEANLLSVEMLTDLFRAGGVRTQLVFVSACHSESAGHSFAAAGVPHVVAVKFDEKVTDYAARVFAEQFYLSLVTGNTVRNAFHIGVASVMAESNAHQDDKKFMLLPEDGNHDVAIFADAQLGEFRDETPRYIKNTANKPPVFFLGRNAKVQEVVCLLYPPQRYRCVTIRGEPGIGKTAVAFRACEYMAERRMFDAIYYVPLNETQFKVTAKEPLCEAIGTALEVGGARNSRDLLRALQGPDPNRRVLLLLDGIDRFLTQGSVLIPTLSFLLGKHQSLHLLITSEGSLNANGDGLLENTPEKVIELGPLSGIDAAHLLVYVAPRRLRFEEMAGGGSRPMGAKTEALAQLSASPVLKELRGHPKAIIMFAPLLETSRLESLAEGAKRCYREGTRSGPSGGGGGGDGGRGPGEGGEGEEEEPRIVLKDASCAKLWTELTTTSGGSRRHSFLLGVPWYRLANALQQQLREALMNALYGSNQGAGRGGLLDVSKASSSSLSSSGSTPLPSPIPIASLAGGGGTKDLHVRQSSIGTSATTSSDLIRGLSETDIQFLRSKLAIQPNSDMVRAKDFEAFCKWWVPVVTVLRLLVHEWMCDAPPLVIGFAGRHDAESMLSGKSEGTFLVRFSTTHLGLLAISFVAPGPSSSSSSLSSSASSRGLSTSASSAISNSSSNGGGGGGDINLGVVQHCLVRVTESGCDLFMEPGRKKYASFQDLIRDCASLVSFCPGGIPKNQALEQLQRLLAQKEEVKKLGAEVGLPIPPPVKPPKKLPTTAL